MEENEGKILPHQLQNFDAHLVNLFSQMLSQKLGMCVGKLMIVFETD